MGDNKVKLQSSTDANEQERSVAAQDLFRGQREIAIRFRGDVYRLRITRNDKLILTK